MFQGWGNENKQMRFLHQKSFAEKIKKFQIYLTSCGSGNVDPRSNKILIISVKVKGKFMKQILVSFEDKIGEISSSLLSPPPHPYRNYLDERLR